MSVTHICSYFSNKNEIEFKIGFEAGAECMYNSDIKCFTVINNSKADSMASINMRSKLHTKSLLLVMSEI